MAWGTFTLQHIISLAAVAAFAAALYFILRRLSDKGKTAVLFAVSLLGVAAVLYDLFRWGRPLEYLPLHLCSLNALIIPFAVLTKNKVASHLTLVWSLGAMLVLIVNTGQAYYEMFSEAFWVFVICHAVDVTVPMLLFITGLVEFDIKKAPATVGVTMGAYTAVHFANLAINKYLLETASPVMAYSRTPARVPQVNYMYSLGDEGNVFFELFRKIIPYDYWHMYLIAPLIFAFLFSVHFIQKKYKKRKAAAKAEAQEV
ncbi:MAG: YwaF family protein [Clostridia bacterium]|nr:YwaF family protein [Clostridia bacterium]